MEPCTRCGATDAHRMFALMSRWFAVHAGLALEGGYFYLCPACYGERIEPEYDAIVRAIQEHQRPDRLAREAPPAGEATPGGAAPREAPAGKGGAPAATHAAEAEAPAPAGADGSAPKRARARRPRAKPAPAEPPDEGAPPPDPASPPPPG